MPQTRRDFLRTASIASVAAVGAACAPRVTIPETAPVVPEPGQTNLPGDASIRDLAMEALNAARAWVSGGASTPSSGSTFIATRERQVTAVNDSESYGIGVRALVNGSWGFAATSQMTREAVQLAAREAARIARAARSAQKRPVELAPVQPPSPERAQVLAILGNLLMVAWRYDESVAAGEQALALARAAGEAGRSMPCVLNAANEVAVATFLDGRLPFLGIPEVVERTLNAIEAVEARDLDDLTAIDAEARRVASAYTRELVH